MILSELGRLKAFGKNNKALILLTYLVILVSFGAKIFYYNFSIDTEEFMLLAPMNGFIQWAEMGRYGLYFFKRFISGYTINVFLINILTYLILGLMSILFSYILDRIYQSRQKGSWIIPATFVSSAILLEQYNFILQSFEVALSNLCVILSVYFFYLFMSEKKKLFLAINIILGVCAFSVYPSNWITFVVVTIIMIIAIVDSSEKRISLKDGLLLIASYIGSFLVIFIMNQLMYNLTLFLLGTQKNPYVESVILWGKLPVSEIFSSIINNTYSLYSGAQSIYFGKLMVLVVIVSYLALFFAKKNRIWLFLLLSSLYFAIHSSIFIFGSIGPIRSLVPYYPLAVGYVYFYIYNKLNLKYVKTIVAIIIVIISFKQMKQSAYLANQENIIYTEASRFNQQLRSKINTLDIKGSYLDYKLAIFGQKQFPISRGLMMGDVLGHSFYNWDVNSPVGVSHRVANFFDITGTPIKRVSEEEYQEILPDFNDMGVFPEEDSVKIEGDIIMVRVS
ncbi:glucosyltransferase domain-containing protein [Enterococcus sp. AZ103]|uniref:glucosyltransferase domain-containing protein n=1 Tax=Enterococcus sp. AZ103 TaxID=2774628 RepID=UPI003F2838A7